MDVRVKALARLDKLKVVAIVEQVLVSHHALGEGAKEKVARQEAPIHKPAEIVVLNHKLALAHAHGALLAHAQDKVPAHQEELGHAEVAAEQKAVLAHVNGAVPAV